MCLFVLTLYMAVNPHDMNVSLILFLFTPFIANMYMCACTEVFKNVYDMHRVHCTSSFPKLNSSVA